MLSALETLFASLFSSASEDGGSNTSQIILFVVLGVFFVLMIVMTIIPQRKQKKKAESMMNSLAIGDKIMTIGGFVGTIVDITSETDRITLNIGTEETPVNVIIVKNAIRSKL